MPRVTAVKAAKIDQGNCSKCGDPIPAGQPYRWWKFNFGAKYKRCMKPACTPKPSDLTQSEFYSTLYDLQERLGNSLDDFRKGESDASSTASELNEIAEELRSLGEECGEKFNNMPEGLQQGDSGQLLENRVSECDSKADELESAASDLESFEIADTWEEYAKENELEPLPEETPEAFQKRVEMEMESARDSAASDADIDLSID